MKSPTVVVLSRNYTTGLGVIRSLGEAGYTVDMIASVKKKGSSAIPASSTYIRNSYEVLAPNIREDDGDGIMEILSDMAVHNREERLLFPTDDYTARIVDENRELLEPHFIFPTSSVGIVRAMDKKFQSNLASRVGFNIPKQWEADLSAEEIKIPDVTYPCFVKPGVSFEGHKTEMAVIYNRDELVRKLLSMKEFYADRTVLIQEYLNIDKEYDMCGVSLNDRVIVPAIIEKTRIAGYERGVTMCGRIMPIDDELKERVSRLIERLAYTGMFDLELNLAGGKIYFGEINLRSGGPNYAYTLAGANLPGLLVQEMYEGTHDPEDEKVKVYGETFVYEKIAWEDYIYGYLKGGKEELEEILNKADHKLMDSKADPKPARMFEQRIRLSEKKHRLLRLAGREEGMVAPADVLVAGRNYGNILSAVRDLGEAGYTVDVLRVFRGKPKKSQIFVNMMPEKESKFVRKYRTCICDGTTDNIAIEVSRMAGDGTVIIPVDDYCLYALDSCRDSIKPAVVMAGINNEEGAVVRMMDKQTQKEEAVKYGLPVLESVLIERAEDIPGNLSYPLFTKPYMSAWGNKASMKRCGDREALEDALAYGPVIAEEYAGIKNEYALLGICVDGKAYTPAMVKTGLGGTKSRKGVAVSGTLEKPVLLKDEVERFVEGTGYTGIYDADLIETKDGKIYFLEINFRGGASMRALTKRGISLNAMFVRAMRCGGYEPGKEAEEGGMFVNEKVLLEECVAGTMEYDDAVEMISGADILFIADEQDPAPGRVFDKYFDISKIAGRIRKAAGNGN